MKFDADKLRAEAEAHEARLKSEWWAPSDGRREESWTASLSKTAATEDAPGSRTRSRSAPVEAAVPTNSPQLDELVRSVEQLREVVIQRPVGGDDMPGWLLVAAGNPRTYDGPDPSRMNVCGRILPSTYDRLKAAQKRMGLRTIAGTWEFLMRLGLATAERLVVP